jgi:hypothetical protein
MPRYTSDWTEAEEKAFVWFETPQDLAKPFTRARGGAEAS